MLTIKETLKITNDKLINFDKNGFSRTIKFTRHNINYYINWGPNICYLSIENQEANKVIFTNITINKTWPSHFNGLYFENNEIPVMLIAKEKENL